MMILIKINHFMTVHGYFSYNRCLNFVNAARARGTRLLLRTYCSYVAQNILFRITADSENLVMRQFKKKLGWPDCSSRGLSPVGSATEMRVDNGHAHLCMLQYSLDMAVLGHFMKI
jgi:hypothetical protein